MFLLVLDYLLTCAHTHSLNGCVHKFAARTTQVNHEGEEAAADGGEGVGLRAQQAQAAAMVSPWAWEGHVTHTVFSVKWAASGLMPVRPQVVLTRDVSIPASSALALF